MLRHDLIEYFGGPTKAADFLGFTRQNIYSFGEVLTQRQADHVRGVFVRKRKRIPPHFRGDQLDQVRLAQLRERATASDSVDAIA